MAQFYRYPTSVSTNPSIATIGGPIPASATLVGFEDPSGNIEPGHVDAAGNILVSAGAPDPGRSYVTSSYYSYAVPVTTAAWTQVIASTPALINHVQFFDSSGQLMELGIGAAAAETRIALIFPGGSPPTDLTIPAGSRLSLRAVTANANDPTTYNAMNFFS